MWSHVFFGTQCSTHSLLTGGAFLGHCVIKELTKIEGEASANNRKAKLFFFYEWELTASWNGKLDFISFSWDWGCLCTGLWR